MLPGETAAGLYAVPKEYEELPEHITTYDEYAKAYDYLAEIAERNGISI